MAVLRLQIVLLLLAGCAQDRDAPLWQAEPGLVYCYRTLAAPDCHRRPLPGAESRLIAAAPQVVFTPVAAPVLPASPMK